MSLANLLHKMADSIEHLGNDASFYGKLEHIFDSMIQSELNAQEGNAIAGVQGPVIESGTSEVTTKEANMEQRRVTTRLEALRLKESPKQTITESLNEVA